MARLSTLPVPRQRRI